MRGELPGWIVLLIVVAVAGFFCVSLYGEVGVRAQVAFTIKDKVVKVGSDSSRYLIFTEENEVFENTDSWLNGKYNSSDYYGSLSIGKSYNATVTGWRFPPLSWYRNIIVFTEK
jgi:hypothetical protein